MMAPEAIAASEPSRSPITLTSAARVLMLSLLRDRIQATSRLIEAPSAATTSTMPPLHGLRMHQALDGFPADPAHQGQHHQAVDERGQRFGAHEAERVARRRRTLGDHLRQQGQAQGGGVGDHVAGVRDQGQRIRQEAGDDLDQREQQRQAQREHERLLAARFDGMGMACVTVEVGVQVGRVVRLVRHRHAINSRTGHQCKSWHSAADTAWSAVNLCEACSSRIDSYNAASGG